MELLLCGRFWGGVGRGGEEREVGHVPMGSVIYFIFSPSRKVVKMT
jgi:hypothetical protein